MDSAVLDQIMQGIHERHTANPAEAQVSSRAIKPLFSSGVGHLLGYVDEDLLAAADRAADSFAYITTGALVIEGMAVSVSVLSNNLDSKNYLKAILAVAAVVYEDGRS